MDILLLSTADWNNPIWTNKQHVAIELARLGHRVLYIDSLGLRAPSANARDISRVVRRVWRALRRPRLVRERLWVWSPLVLPWHGRRWARVCNRVLLSAGSRLWLAWLRFQRVGLWTYSPVTAEYLDVRAFAWSVYHCVDEIKAQPGMPSAFLGVVEKQLSEKVGLIFTTSPMLTESRKRWNPRTFYFPNVADYTHFTKALDESTRVPADLACLPHPRLGFIGAISGYKLDLNLICRIGELQPKWSLVLIGPVGEGDPWTDTTELRRMPNIHLLGARSYASLPAYLKGFDVALLPNRLSEYTSAMFPMKFFEYLAAGRPIVSTELPALHEFADVLYTASDAEGFVHAVERALLENGDQLQARLAVARQHTYESRTHKMLDMLNRVYPQ